MTWNKLSWSYLRHNSSIRLEGTGKCNNVQIITVYAMKAYGEIKVQIWLMQWNQHDALFIQFIKN
jgi:hypothetical protein